MRIIKLFFIVPFVALGCIEEKNTFQKGKYENYNPDNFYPVKGIVYEVNTYFSLKYWETSRDIFYMYQIDSLTILEDEIKESTLMGIKEGDFIEVLVHKDEPKINFYNGRGRR